jgi:hypothetical protein
MARQVHRQLHRFAAIVLRNLLFQFAHVLTGLGNADDLVDMRDQGAQSDVRCQPLVVILTVVRLRLVLF